MTDKTVSFGNMDSFNPENETISAYLERFDLFIQANGVAEEKKVPVFLSVIGGKTYSLLRNLLSPALPKEKDFAALATELKNHFEPKKVVIVERFNFYRRNQQVGESIATYVAELRRLATDCAFNAHLTEALRDKFVCGLRSEATQRRLLAEKDLTFTKAVEIAQGMEVAARDTQLFKSNGGAINKVSQVHEQDRVDKVKFPKPCFRCGRNNHTAAQCRFKDATCRKCQKKGHIAAVCRSGQTNPNSGGRRPQTKQTGRTQYVGCNPNPEQEEDIDDLPIYRVSKPSSHPITVELEINHKKLLMEIDTGAAVSVISRDTYNKLFSDTSLNLSTVRLKTYTGEPMPVAGELDVEVKYGLQVCTLSLTVVEGSGPSLLGRDWLCHLTLDWKTIGLANLDMSRTQVEALQKKYKDVFAPGLGTLKNFKAHITVKQGARPVFHRPRAVPFALKEAIEVELARLEAEGVIEKVNQSEWAAHIVAVPKSDGRIRICGDYKVTVNPHIEPDRHPLPKPDDLFASLSGGKKFTKIDLSHAYLQMMLDDESKKFMVINTHKGLYQYTRMPFGISSAPAIFQHVMDTILQGLSNVLCYLDDILITGATDQEHIHNLEEVLKRLQCHGIKVQNSKCTFLANSVEYLGHIIDHKGLHTSPQKVAAIQDAPAPSNQQQLRSLLGLLHYYGKFIPNLATLLHPMNRLLKSGSVWNWSPDCQQAFAQAKKLLSSAAVLAHYNPSLPLRLATDASAYGIGAVISHIFPDGSERPIAFASRTLSNSEKRYAQLEKEALSLIFGVQKFHPYLYGRAFTLYTDHKPLTTILSPKKGIPPLSAARLQRWALLLAAYSYDIVYKSTKDHANADGLSRLPLPITPTTECQQESTVFNIAQIDTLPVTVKQLKAATRQDSVLSKVLLYTKCGWPSTIPEVLKPYWKRRLEISLEDECIIWGIRVIIPYKLRKKVLQELHQSHVGIVRMKATARSYLWWPGLDQEIEELVKGCTQCQSVRNAPEVAPLHPWLWPTKPWKRIHIDFAGPLRGHSYLILVDAHSKWPEVIDMKSNTTSAATITELRKIFARYGLPEQLVSDNGLQFVSAEFTQFLKSNGVKHIKSAPYHPSTNGIAERFVQSFKRAMLTNESLPIEQRLANFLLQYRTTVHATTNATPSMLLMNRQLRTRLDLLRPNMEGQVVNKEANQKVTHDQHSRDREFMIGQRVMARNLRPGPKWIPGTIVGRNGPLSYVVQVEGGQVWKRHIEHLREVGDTPSG